MTVRRELIDSLSELLEPYEEMEAADLFAKLPGTEAQRVVRARAVLNKALGDRYDEAMLP